MMHFLPIAALAAAGAMPHAQRVPAADILRAVEAAVADRLASSGSTARLQAVGRIRDQQVPAGSLRIEVGDAAGRWPREHVAVPVRLWVDGRPIRSLTIRAEMHDPRVVPVYEGDYATHQAAAAVHVVLREVDMICCADGKPADVAALSSARLRHAVRTGKPALQSDFESMPEVLAQEPVTIEVSRGAVRITTTGVALDDGRIGERIPVRPERSRVAVSSRVVGKERVAIDE